MQMKRPDGIWVDIQWPGIKAGMTVRVVELDDVPVGPEMIVTKDAYQIDFQGDKIWQIEIKD